MKQQTAQLLRLRDYEPRRDDFCAEVKRGLRQARKQLPCKFFYDERGSALFDRICELEEYYPTRTELAIMRRGAREIAELLGERCLVVEYGSGSSAKTRVLLDHLPRPAGYVPIDISRVHLLRAAGRLSTSYPGLEVLPVCADYTADFSLPERSKDVQKTVAYFPGSTIGNFEPDDARAFLAGIRELCGPASGLLIGVDLKKDPRVLHAAYNDASGVTAEFNLNLLARMNRELDGDFDLSRFAHYAFYNPRLGRIEMHLLSMENQSASAADERFDFREGESIFTESSYKYAIEEFASLAGESGYRVDHVWTDDRRLFSVQYLTAR